jgi:hypothetical protein
MFERRFTGASLALAVHLATAVAVPLTEPWHVHESATENQWHAQDDLCATPTPLDECALLRHSQTKALPAVDADGPRPPSPTRAGPVFTPKTRSSTPSVTLAYPRGPPTD